MAIAEMNISIEFDGEMVFCTMQEFADANADDMPATVEEIADHLLLNDSFHGGGGAASEFIIRNA